MCKTLLLLLFLKSGEHTYQGNYIILHAKCPWDGAQCMVLQNKTYSVPSDDTLAINNEWNRWHHDMETRSVSSPIYEGNLQDSDSFIHKGPVTESFYFFLLFVRASCCTNNHVVGDSKRYDAPVTSLRWRKGRLDSTNHRVLFKYIQLSILYWPAHLCYIGFNITHID